MQEHLDTHTTPTATEHEEIKAQRSPSETQLAAVVEAAYILEAVRK